MDTDYVTQLLGWILGNIPVNWATNIVGVVSIVVTLCTLIIRFWPEPKAGSFAHKLWVAIHVLAAFRVPTKKI